METEKVWLNRNCKYLFWSWYHLYETICHETAHALNYGARTIDVTITPTGKQIHNEEFAKEMEEYFNLNVTHEGGGCDMRENFEVDNVLPMSRTISHLN